MEELLNSMDPVTQAQMSSSSRAAKDIRKGVVTTTLDHKDAIETTSMAGDRLKNDLLKVESEIQRLGDLISGRAKPPAANTDEVKGGPSAEGDKGSPRNSRR